MKKKWVAAAGIVLAAAIAVLSATTGTFYFRKDSTEEVKVEKDPISIGFCQVGAESDWRTANTRSIKRTFTPEKGYDLIFEDGRQKQSNQIKAIRGFIRQGVDYIIFSPVVERGWDKVLREAKQAGIPVIIIDRIVDVEDDSLYTAWVGTDVYMQGRKACEALRQYVENSGIGEVNIVHIQGTMGATPQIARTQMLEEAAKKYGWNLLAQESGDYTEAKGYEVMSEMLEKYDDINFVYCENDNEAFGAIEAIEASGRTVGPGGDIQVISFDATAEGLRYVLDGKILVDAESNPDQGPECEKIISQLEKGKIPEKYHRTEEQIFSSSSDISTLNINGQLYDIEPVSEGLILTRDY